MSWFNVNLPSNGNTGFSGLAGTTPPPSSLGGTTPPGGPGGYVGGSPTFSESAAAVPPSGGQGAATGNPSDRNYVRQQLMAVMQQHGITPGARGSGPADLEYYTDQAMATGGWTPGNAGYWQDRWVSDLHGGGGSGGGGGGFGGGMGSNSPLLAPYTKTYGDFTPPSGLDLQNDPGYQARLKMGTDALQSSAAARGKLLTGGTLKDLTQYAQDYASNEFQNVYNRAYNTYNTNRDTFGANYDIYRNNQNDPFNKLYSLTGLGLGAAGGANAAAGQYAGNLGGNTSLYASNNANTANGVSGTQQGIGNVQAGSQIAQGNNDASFWANFGGQLAGVPWYRRASAAANIYANNPHQPAPGTGATY